MAKKQTDVLLLSGEAAEVLGISREAVRQAENRGALRGLKTRSGYRFFALSDVQAFKAERVKKLEERLAALRSSEEPKARKAKVAR